MMGRQIQFKPRKKLPPLGYCEHCGRTRENVASLSRVQVLIPDVSHNQGSPTGQYDSMVLCPDCHEELTVE